MSRTAELERGLVVGSHGRHVVVETPEGRQLICHPRGKNNQAVVGDRVLWLPSGDEGSVEQIEPRRNLFYRQDEVRTKSFAANVDQVLILIAAEPEFSESQLARALVAAEAEQILPVIVLNKSDLAEAHARAWARLAPYQRMGYTVLPLNLKAPGLAPELTALQAQLRGRATLVLGPSGAGKSTLINRVVPGAQAQTGEISTALNSGKHTTTSTRWYWIDSTRQTALIDSPGFQEFGLRHIAAAQLATLMPDLRAQAGSCRFYNCSHLHEPDCGVIAAVDTADEGDGISPSRYRIYSELHAELSQAPRY
ncbi:MAG: ribosome small subunit-dependent GTPase A [Curvibacter sp.]